MSDSNTNDSLQHKVSDLHMKLSQLNADDSSKLIYKFNEMVEIEKVTTPKNQDNHYMPPLQKGQVVQVKFIGQGTVLNGKHFAIIWYVQPKEGQVVVLPMTSKIKPGQEMFDLGQIDSLNSAINVVLFHQPITVSRKSIHIWTKKVRNKEGHLIDIALELSDFQKLHLNSIFRYSQIREKDLFYRLVFELNNQVPKTFPSDLIQNLNKHIKVIINQGELQYKLNHQTDFTKIDLFTPQIDSKQRLDLLKGIFSKDPVLRDNAEKIIINLLLKTT